MDYSTFSVEDFVADDYFVRWVCQNDSEAEKFWNLFLTVHPEAGPKIDLARACVLNLRRAEHVHIDENQVEDIWAGIQGRMEKSEDHPKRRRRFLSLSYGIAASLIVIAFFIGINYPSGDKAIQENRIFTDIIKTDKEGYTEEVNNTPKTVRIHLSDGSIVALERNSRLRYKTRYDGEGSRHVYLTGEAFFEVAKNPKQPFFVHANEVTTKVLGTSFRVKAYGDDKNITVAVTAGKVSVFSPKKVKDRDDDMRSEVNGVILLPNQQVVYQRDQELFNKELVESPVVVQPGTDVDFNFDNAPIKEVFHLLENAYGIEIIFDEEVMRGCFITVPLGTEPLFEKLGIICRAIGASYETIDTRVVINSSGCQDLIKNKKPNRTL